MHRKTRGEVQSSVAYERFKKQSRIWPCRILDGFKIQNAKYKIENTKIKCKIQNAREIELHSLFWLYSLYQLWQSITQIVHLLVIKSLLLRIEVCPVPAIHNLCFHKKYIFFIIYSHSLRYIVCCCKPYFDNSELSYQKQNIIDLSNNELNSFIIEQFLILTWMPLKFEK